MKLFECQHCGQPLYFENTRCESCGRSLGYLPADATISALEEGKRGLRALAERRGRYRYCANAQLGACNWLVSVDSPEQFCAACRHNRTIPDLSLADNQANWRKIELAKHRLFYTLLKLRLPLTTKLEDPERGLAFDFLVAAPPNSAPSEPVLTGHDSGLITINLAEADDSERERMRRQMGEPYRTLLGHFRHEIAHYYWDRLVLNAPHIEAFRQLFGDEREDGTILYLVATPQPRLELVVAKVAAAWTASLVLLVPSLVLSGLLGLGSSASLRLIGWPLLGVVLASLAYCAASSWLSLKTRRPVVIGVIYILLWEGSVATYAASAAKLSISAYGSAFVAHALPQSAPPVAGLVPSALVLAAVVVLAALGAARSLARTELP